MTGVQTCALPIYLCIAAGGISLTAPIPQDELERTTEWVKSWGMLEETESPLDLVNVLIQEEAHRPAAE